MGLYIDRVVEAGCQPFYFDLEKAEFRVADQVFPINDDLETQIYNSDRLRELRNITASELVMHPLVSSITGEMYALPMMLRAYLTVDQALESRDQVVSAMQLAHNSMTGEMLGADFFHCWLEPDKPMFTQVLGAELHQMAEGQIGERGWPFSIYEYGMNNADLPEWKVTLLAGIGQLATIAANT